MKIDVLQYLACPECKGDLALKDDTTRVGQVDRGVLQCGGCDAKYPIEHGVPVFVPVDGEKSVEQTTEGFARNWNEFNEIIVQNVELNDELFRDWVDPLNPASFEDQVVLEPGCGMGRWLKVAARYRPKALIGVDYSTVAYTAHKNTADQDRVHVLRADIRKLPLKPVMDTIFSLGVVHHTPDPEATFDAITTVLAPEGRMSVWVYGKENNGWITSLVDPIRKNFTSKLPHDVLYWVSKGLAAEVYGAAWVYERFFKESGFPYGPYLEHLRRYPFKYMEHIVYDHLVPEIAHYIPKHDLERWATKNGLAHNLSARNNNSWRLLVSRSQQVLDDTLAGNPRRKSSRADLRVAE